MATMGAAAAIAEEEVEQQAEEGAVETAAAETDAAATEGAAQAGGEALAESELPAVGDAASKVVESPTPSEQAFGSDANEVTPSDRDFLIRATKNRMAAAISPFTLACSNRREEVSKAVQAHPEFLNTLGKLAMGELLPGIEAKKQEVGVMTPSTQKLVEGQLGKSAHMKKVVNSVGKIPMQNFKLNFGAVTATESSEELMDQLGVHVAMSNEEMRNSVEDSSNEDLAALCAAFDPKSMTCSVYEDALDRELAKLSTDEAPKLTEEEATDLQPQKELAYVGDPGEGDQAQLAVVETDPKKQGEEKNKVVDMVPDEMKEMAISKNGQEPGTLYEDELYRRA